MIPAAARLQTRVLQSVTYILSIIQSLLTTCRLQAIDPYYHVVNVPQCVSRHPGSRILEPTPRLRKSS
jgi:hypothetical protein